LWLTHKVGEKILVKFIIPDREWRALEPMGRLYTHPNPFVRFVSIYRLRIVLHALRIRGQVERILDAGCGNGVLMPSLSRVAKLVVGVDVDKGALAVAKNMIRRSSQCGYVELVCCDIHKLPFRNKVFDYCVSVSVLDHLKDIKLALQNIKNSLKTAGSLIVGIMPPLPTPLAYIWSVLAAGHRYIFAEHVNTYVECLSAIAEHFTITSIKGPLGIPLFYVAVTATLEPREDLNT